MLGARERWKLLDDRARGRGATADVVAVARHGAAARLGGDAIATMEETAAVVERLAESDEPPTGSRPGSAPSHRPGSRPSAGPSCSGPSFGSHAAGMGPPVEREVVRAMVFLRIRSLAMGRSGARPVLAETMLAMLDGGLDPVVPEHGSLGASGDLAPLAHCALAMMGEGEVLAPKARRPPRARRSPPPGSSRRCSARRRASR